MATFTMFFKDAIEKMGGEIVTTDEGTLLNNAIDVGLGSYPIFMGSYRNRLNGLIVDRYMNREIGVESISEFRLLLRSRMNEIMPMYNRMYEADRVKFDPLRTYDIRTISKGTAESTSNASVTSESRDRGTSTTDAEGNTEAETSTESDNRSRAVASDTPGVHLSPDEDYASSAADQTGKSTGTGESSESSTSHTAMDSESIASGESSTTSDAESTQETESHTFGYQGNPSELIIAYRNSLQNTDMLVLKDLDTCFMQVYADDSIPLTGYDRFGYVYRRF